MRLSIHNRSARFAFSVLLFFSFFLVFVPQLFSTGPPSKVVAVLFWPAGLIGQFIGKLVPHPNIGASERPVYEGTPIDLFVGLALVVSCMLLYSGLAYCILSILSKVIGRKTA